MDTEKVSTAFFLRQCGQIEGVFPMANPEIQQDHPPKHTDATQGEGKTHAGAPEAAHVYGSESPSALGKIWNAMSSVGSAVGSHVKDNSEKVLGGHGTVLNDLELVGEVAVACAAAGAVGMGALGTAAGAVIGGAAEVATGAAIGGAISGGFAGAVFEGTVAIAAKDRERERVVKDAE